MIVLMLAIYLSIAFLLVFLSLSYDNLVLGLGAAIIFFFVAGGVLSSGVEVETGTTTISNLTSQNTVSVETTYTTQAFNSVFNSSFAISLFLFGLCLMLYFAVFFGWRG